MKKKSKREPHRKVDGLVVFINPPLSAGQTMTVIVPFAFYEKSVRGRFAKLKRLVKKLKAAR